MDFPKPPPGFVLQDDTPPPPPGFQLERPQTQATPATPAIARPSSTIRRVVGDTAVDLGKGLLGVGEAVVGAGNIVSGGYIGKGLEAIGYDPVTSKKMLEEGYTPERVAANKEVADAKGFMPTIAAAIKNPSTIAGAVVESAPLMLGGAGLARGGATLLGKAGSIARPGLMGQLAAIPQTVTGRIGLAAAGEGLVSAGSAAESIRQQSDDGLLSAKGAAASLGAGAGTAILGALGGKAAQKLGIADVDVALAGGSTLAGPKKNILRRAAQGVLAEGVFEELPQSAQEQMWQNYATGKPIMDGVAEAAAMGALAGGVMGGGFSAIAGNPKDATTDKTTSTETPSGVGRPLSGSIDVSNAPSLDDAQPATPDPFDGNAINAELDAQNGQDRAQSGYDQEAIARYQDQQKATIRSRGIMDGTIPPPQKQAADNLRAEAQVMDAQAQTGIGKAAAMATAMQADAIEQSNPFGYQPPTFGYEAPTFPPAPNDGRTRLAQQAQAQGIDPRIVLTLDDAEAGELDQYDDKLLATYAKGLWSDLQSGRRTLPGYNPQEDGRGPRQDAARPVQEQSGVDSVGLRGDAVPDASSGGDAAGAVAVQAGDGAASLAGQAAVPGEPAGAQAEGVIDALSAERRSRIGEDRTQPNTDLDNALNAILIGGVNEQALMDAVRYGVENGRPEIARAAAVELRKSANSAAKQKPGVPEGSPKYAAIAADLARRAQEAAKLADEAEAMATQPAQPAKAAPAHSTRDNPLPTERMGDAPVGSWVAGPPIPGTTPADTVRQIVEVPIEQIDATEFTSNGKLVADKQADASRYAEAMRNGDQFPNARGSVLPNGKIKLQDGHRRLAAAIENGAATLRVAVNPMPEPAAPKPAQAVTPDQIELPSDTKRSKDFPYGRAERHASLYIMLAKPNGSSRGVRDTGWEADPLREQMQAELDSGKFGGMKNGNGHNDADMTAFGNRYEELLRERYAEQVNAEAATQPALSAPEPATAGQAPQAAATPTLESPELSRQAEVAPARSPELPATGIAPQPNQATLSSPDSSPTLPGDAAQNQPKTTASEVSVPSPQGTPVEGGGQPIQEAIDSDPVLASNRDRAVRAATMDEGAFVAAEVADAATKAAQAGAEAKAANELRIDYDARLKTHVAATRKFRLKNASLRKNTPEALVAAESALREEGRNLRRREEMAAFDLQQAKGVTEPSMRAMYGRLRERLAVKPQERVPKKPRSAMTNKELREAETQAIERKADEVMREIVDGRLNLTRDQVVALIREKGIAVADKTIADFRVRQKKQATDIAKYEGAKAKARPVTSKELKAQEAGKAQSAPATGVDDAAVRAAYNAAMTAKTGQDYDWGKGDFGDMIVGALNRDPEVMERARNILTNGNNETGLKVFFKQAGVKFPKTQREQKAAFDAYIGVSPETRAASDAEEAKAQADKRAQKVASRRARQPVPDFTDYAEAVRWLNNRSEAFPSKGAYKATPEFAEWYEKAKPLYAPYKEGFTNKRAAALAEAGIKAGDRVQTSQIGMFMTGGTWTGTVTMRGGDPWVKVDGDGIPASKNGKVKQAKLLRWDARWKKAEVAATSPAETKRRAPTEEAKAEGIVATQGPADARGERKFYVTIIRDSKVARLAGPFDTKAEADGMVDRASNLARELDPRAAFDGFGVSAVTSENHKPGRLNEQLGIGTPASETKPEPKKPRSAMNNKEMREAEAARKENKEADKEQEAQKAPQKAEPFEHNGTRIYPTKIKFGDEVVTRFAVESADNKARREAGERTLGGDSLHATREAAIKAAEQESVRRAQREAREQELAAEQAASDKAKAERKERNAGKSLAQIKADDYLDAPVSIGGKPTTRRARIEAKIAAGEKPSITMVNKIKPMSRMAFHRTSNEEQAAHERKVRAGGKVAEYAVGDSIVSKTEYDYAVGLVAAQEAKPAEPQPAPSQQQADRKYAKYDEAAKEYGRSVRDDGAILKGGKESGLFVREKGKRLRIEDKDGNLTYSGAPTGEALGKFMESFWFAEKQQPASKEAADVLESVEDFRGVSRAEFLGKPRITKDSNASDLRPLAGGSIDSAPVEPFLDGKYTAKFSDIGGAVFDGDKVIASYDKWATLAVDKKFRRQGIGAELVYQFRTRYPDTKPATHRTKKAQALQEKVWDRITRELRSTSTLESIESETLADTDATPAELASLKRQSQYGFRGSDGVGMTDAEKSAIQVLDREESRANGIEDADKLGLRKAVNAAIGSPFGMPPITAVYLRGPAGLDGIVKEGYIQRLKDQQKRRTGTKTAGLYLSEKDTVDGRPRFVLFTDVARTPALAAFTAAHEVAGHHGLRALLGNKLNPVLDRAGQNATVKAIADSMTKQRSLKPEQRRLAIEEALADLAAAVKTKNFQRIKDKHGVEVPKVMQSRVRAMLDTIVQRIRELFRIKNVRFSDGQVRQLLEASWQAAQGNRATMSVVGANGALEQVVFHGTPHTVDRFSLQKIGTGEGAQAFGWGAYFASLRDIADHYRESLSGDLRGGLALAGVVPSATDKRLSNAVWTAAKNLSELLVTDAGVVQAFGGLDVVKQGRVLDVVRTLIHDDQVLDAVVRLVPVDVVNVLGGKERSADYLLHHPTMLVYLLPADANNLVPAHVEAMNVLAPAVALAAAKVHTGLARFDVAPSDFLTATGALVQGVPPIVASKIPQPSEFRKGNLYRVDVPEDADLLDWDKPLSEQPALSRRVIFANAWQHGLYRISSTKDVDDFTGADLYRSLSRSLGGEQAASEALNAAGIPGLRYLDGTSRAKGEGSANYVIWDESAIGTPSSALESVDNDGMADDDYRGEHSAPMKDSGAPGHDVTGGGNFYPDDVYGPNGLRYYGTGYDAMDAEAYGHIRRLKNHPNYQITVYRAVPKSVKGGIKAGDWVTTVRRYALDHGRGALNGDYKIQSKIVRANEIFTNGDSWLEWGYDPQPFDEEAQRQLRERRAAKQQQNEPLESTEDQTQSEAFKNWFGKSVVTEDGKAGGVPLVVYHGTRGNFDVFQSSPHSDLGHHFGGAKQAEGRLLESRGKTHGLGKVGIDPTPEDGHNENVMPVFLAIKNPLRMVDTGFFGSNDEDFRAVMRENGILVLQGMSHDQTIAAIERRGYDGIVYENTAPEEGSGESWVAFRPEQIKSATGNSGNFNPDNPSILESVEAFTLSDNPTPADTRIPGEITLDPLHKAGVKGVLARLGKKFTDLKPAALALVPLQEMDDFTPKTVQKDGTTVSAQPAVATYIQLQNDMQAMRNTLYVDYDKTAQDLHAYSTVGAGIKGFFGKAVNQQGRDLFALMHDSTIAGVDPSEQNVRYKDPGKAAKYRDLQERYAKIPKEGQDLFKAVRDAYAAQTDLLDEVIEANATRAAEITTNRARRKLEDREREIREDGNLNPLEKAKASAAAKKAYDDTVNEGGTASKIAALRKMLEANRVPKPYFPLKRYGKYWVSVLKDGKLAGFSKFETAAEQSEFSKSMVAQGYSTRLKYEGDAAQTREMIDPKFVADVEEILTGLPDQIRDDVWQAYLERMPDMSLRKSFIHRKNVAGYHFDALKAFGSTLFHGSHQIARLKYGMEMAEAIDVAKEQANALRESDPEGALAADMVAGELEKRHAFIMNPTNAKWAQKVSGAAFLYSLGANPAHLFLNATQTIMLGVPILGTRYGFGRASKALTKAARDFAKGKGHLEKANLTTDELRAFRELQASGIIEKSQAHDIAGIGAEGVEYDSVRKKVMDKIGWFMHQSERFNREVTAMAGYRLARAEGRSHEAAMAEASKHVYQIHFDYSNAARARVMQGDMAKALLVFRNYQANMIYRLFRDIHQSIRGESPQVKREARKQLGAIMGMYGLFAGTMGVPFYGLAMALAGAFDDEDDPVTAEQQFVNGTVEFLGPTAAKVLLRGIPGTLFDVDLTERIGMGNLWFRSPQQEMEGRDAYYYWMEQLLGAGVAPVKGVFDGINLAMQGQIQRGMERASPAALRNPMQAIRMAQEGGVTSLDGDLIKEVNGGDMLTKALGFQPLSVSEQYEANNEIKGADRRLSNRRQRLMNRYFLARQMGDDTAEAMADIQAFNLKNPEYAITRDTMQRSAKTRARNSANSEGGIVMTRRMRRLQDRLNTEETE